MSAAMHPDMARWIEVAAEKGHDEECESEYRWKDLREGQREMIRDMVRRDVMNVLQAAAADGVKLTPRALTEDMRTAAHHSNRAWFSDEWGAAHEAAPNYLGDTP